MESGVCLNIPRKEKETGAGWVYLTPEEKTSRSQKVENWGPGKSHGLRPVIYDGG